ncbi:MAG: transposase [Bacteroidetes bacterium]|nr:transposase [Bacteroidota bacterium]
MAQSILQVYVHLVFSTAGRVHFFTEKETKERLFGYMMGVMKKLQAPVLAIGGGEEHVHILHRMPKNLNYEELTSRLKANSSRFAKTMGDRYSKFGWNRGFAGFSVSRWDIDMIVGYIRKQERHHNTEIYKAELERLLAEHGAEFDNRHLWD